MYIRVVTTLVTLLILSGANAVKTLGPVSRNHIQSLQTPSVVWTHAILPPAIHTPEINWEEAQRQNDLRELEEAHATALLYVLEKKQAEARIRNLDAAAPKTQIPWEQRPVVSGPQIPFGGYLGRFQAPSVGVDQEVRWDFEQSTVDHPARMCIWGYSGLPGEPEYAVMLYDHNYQTGRILASLAPNAAVFLETPWGKYAYRLISSEIAGDLPDDERKASWDITNRVGEKTNRFIGEFASPSHPYGWVYDATHRSPENDGELWFATCYPLNAAITNKRLVLRFQCVDGPLLDWWHLRS